MTKIRKYIENYWEEIEKSYDHKSQEYHDLMLEKNYALSIESSEILDYILFNSLNYWKLFEGDDHVEYSDNEILFIDRTSLFPYEKNPLISKFPYTYLKSKTFDKELTNKKCYFLFSLFPLGIDIDIDCKAILKELSLIEDAGYGAFLIPESDLTTGSNKSLEKLMNEKGFFINALIGLPADFHSFTKLKCLIVFFGKKPTKEIFISEAPNNFEELDEVSPTFLTVGTHPNTWEFDEENWLEIGKDFNDIEKKFFDLDSVGDSRMNFLDSEYVKIQKKSSLDPDYDYSSYENALIKFHTKIFRSIHSLKNGQWIWREDFDGFEKIKLRYKLESQSDEFSYYKKYNIQYFSETFNLCKTGKKFSSDERSLFVPKLGKQKCGMKLEDLVMKHQNYIQIIFKKDQELNIEYIYNFLNTETGKIYLDLNKNLNSTIPMLTLSGLKDLEIPIPPLPTQKNIIENLRKLEEAKSAMDRIQENIMKYPSSKEDNLLVNKMLKAIGSLKKTDEIRMLASEEESKILEFKETFWMCADKKTKEKHLMFSTLKTIGAFLNSNGGKLLIGISDDHKITGLNEEIVKFHKGSSDKFLNSFKDYIKGNLGSGKSKNKGAKYMDLMNYEIISVDGKKVLFLETRRSNEDVLIEEQGVEKLPVRLGPATDLLQGKQMLDYSKNRAN